MMSTECHSYLLPSEKQVAAEWDSSRDFSVAFKARSFDHAEGRSRFLIAAIMFKSILVLPLS
jgi:hypothetical protein